MFHKNLRRMHVLLVLNKVVHRGNYIQFTDAAVEFNYALTDFLLYRSVHF